MWKLNRKSGVSLIEVLCSISIFLIIFTSALTAHLNNLKLEKYNEELNKYIYVLEAVKKEILFNTSYEDIKSIYNSGKKFIPKDKLSFDNIKNLEIKNLFISTDQYNDTYLEMNITEEDILKIALQLHIRFQNKEEIIKCNFYKGNYL